MPSIKYEIYQIEDARFKAAFASDATLKSLFERQKHINIFNEPDIYEAYALKSDEKAKFIDIIAQLAQVAPQTQPADKRLGYTEIFVLFYGEFLFGINVINSDKVACKSFFHLSDAELGAETLKAIFGRHFVKSDANTFERVGQAGEYKFQVAFAKNGFACHSTVEQSLLAPNIFKLVLIQLHHIIYENFKEEFARTLKQKNLDEILRVRAEILDFKVQSLIALKEDRAEAYEIYKKTSKLFGVDGSLDQLLALAKEHFDIQSERMKMSEEERGRKLQIIITVITIMTAVSVINDTLQLFDRFFRR